MTEFPYLPLWTDAYMADTLDLQAEDHAIYIVMLMLAWKREDNAIPNDMKWLKKTLSSCFRDGMHGHTFNARVPKILTRFWKLHQDGKWHQKRLDKEKKFLRDRSDEQRRRANLRWQNQTYPQPVDSLKPQNSVKLSSNEVQTEIKRSVLVEGFEQKHTHRECGGNAPTPTPSLLKKAYTYPQEKVERCSTCGGVYPDASIGRVSGCVCPPDPDWKPKPLPPGLATVRSNGARQDQPADSGAGDGVVFDLRALLAGFGTPNVGVKTPLKADGKAAEVPVPKPKTSWKRLADGTFERV